MEECAMSENKSARKFGKITYAVGFAFIAASVVLNKFIMRDLLPPIMLNEGSLDWIGLVINAAVGAAAGIVGMALGAVVESVVRRYRATTR